LSPHTSRSSSPIYATCSGSANFRPPITPGQTSPVNIEPLRFKRGLFGPLRLWVFAIENESMRTLLVLFVSLTGTKVLAAEPGILASIKKLKNIATAPRLSYKHLFSCKVQFRFPLRRLQ
jgi:hypothetical protein